MKTKEQMNEMREQARAKRAAQEQWQAENTHELDGGYVAMPTIQRYGVGWELHPPKGRAPAKGEPGVFTGPIWYEKDLVECRQAVSRHRRFYTGDGKLLAEGV